MSNIKLAIFAVESVAHLQHRERDFLPVADAAREELAEILAFLKDVREWDDKVAADDSHYSLPDEPAQRLEALILKLEGVK